MLNDPADTDCPDGWIERHEGTYTLCARCADWEVRGRPHRVIWQQPEPEPEHFQGIVTQLDADLGPMRVAVAALVLGAIGLACGVLALVLGWPR